MSSIDLGGSLPASPPRPGPTRRAWLLLAPALLVGGLGLWWSARRTGGDAVDIRGVRLGLSLSDTRTRFQTPDAGVWSLQSSPEPVLEWSSGQGEASPVRRATFEFHNGMLMAIRLQVAATNPEAAGPELEVGATRVLHRQRQEGLATVTVLSRTCPTHAAEVRALLSGAPR
jgi:hypothetical protein